MVLMEGSEAELRAELDFFSRAASHVAGDAAFLGLGAALGLCCWLSLCRFSERLKRLAGRLRRAFDEQ
eukprot:3875070-Prymnesium_polylepis.1